MSSTSPDADLAAAVALVAERLGALLDGDSPGDDLWPPVVDDGVAADGARFGERWQRLVDSAGLDHVDLSLLVAAAAPSLDRRFVELYAGLGSGGRTGDDRTVRAGDLFAVNGLSTWDPAVRERLTPRGALVRAGLVVVSGHESAVPSATVSVSERVVAWMLGDDRPDTRVLPAVTEVVGLSTDAVLDVCRALRSGRWNVWVRERSGGGTSVGASALATLGAPAIVVDLRRASMTLAEAIPLVVLEAVLCGGGVVVGPVDPQRDAEVLGRLDPMPVRPMVFVSTRPWDPSGSSVVPIECEVSPLSLPERAEVWRNVIGDAELDAEGALDDSVDELASLRLAPEQIAGAVRAAVGAAVAADEPVSAHHLRHAALAFGSNRLSHLAQRVVPQATFDDLVVPDALSHELRSIPGRHRTRHVVRDEWGMGRGGGRGSGLTSLFAGPSGTGKTLAAEVVANALGVDLFIIDLSQIVDKYIGETEKNLDRVFSEAESVNGVLLFDEADALFGKRSEVSDAHDRHANVEVAYLLQRMERYDGVAILTTNFRGNIDEAFMRRLDIVCGFVDPDEPQRRELWRRHLPASVPLASDVDIDLLAAHLEVSGGVISNIALSAAHAAAAEERSITMADLVIASEREYRKLGRLFNQPELSGVTAID